jgi:diguanylate cyclase (GGDEF)-like protein
VSLFRALENSNKALAIAVAVILIGAIGALDFVTGYELSFFTFYFLPLALLAWKGERWTGVAGAVLCTAAWALANYAAGQRYSSVLVAYWNVGMRFLAFGILAIVVWYVKKITTHLDTLSRTDPLTGAANTRAFMEIVRTEIERAHRYRRPLTLAYFDLDNFKAVNDSFGHATGDALLKAVVSAIRSNIRATDSLARLGGDEFALLLPEVDQEAARQVVSKVRAAILLHMRSKDWQVTISVGALTVREHHMGPDELIKQADDLMYDAKTKGKNMAVFSVVQ